MATARRAVAKVVQHVLKKIFVFDAVILDIHDGDTIKLAARLLRLRLKDRDLGFSIYIENGYLTIHIGGRLLGINAPELATDDGKASLAYMLTLVKVGDVVSIKSSPGQNITADKYGGRWDVIITRADGLVINDAMVAAGHAKPWDGVGVKPV